MTGIDDHRDPGEYSRHHTVMMNQMIMRMQNVRPVVSQLSGHFPYGAEVWPGRFLKRSHAYASRRRLSRKPAGMSKAIEYRYMALRKLTIRKVNGQPFKSTHIEIIDKLYDSHRALYSPFLDSAFLVPAYRPSRNSYSNGSCHFAYCCLPPAWLVPCFDSHLVLKCAQTSVC